MNQLVIAFSDGKNGSNGISVAKSEINSLGELVLTYSDNRIENLGALHFTGFCFFQYFLLADDIVVHPFGIAVPLFWP